MPMSTITPSSEDDTVVIIWRTDDVEQANVVHDIVKNEMKYGDAAELRPTVRHISSFGAMSGCIFLAYGEDGIDRLDAMIVDNLAAELPCETELWLGTADDVRPSRSAAGERKRAKGGPQTDLQ